MHHDGRIVGAVSCIMMTEFQDWYRASCIRAATSCSGSLHHASWQYASAIGILHHASANHCIEALLDFFFNFFPDACITNHPKASCITHHDACITASAACIVHHDGCIIASAGCILQRQLTSCIRAADIVLRQLAS